MERRSSLQPDIHFHGDGSLNVYLYDSANNFHNISGTYTYANRVISIGPNNLILQSETSTSVEYQLGIVARFRTRIAGGNRDEMVCVAMGHNYDLDSPGNYRQFNRCERQNFNNLLYENSFNFEALNSIVPNTQVAGAFFRSRTWDNNTFVQGYGFYRRQGNKFYAYSYNAFDDSNYLSGEFSDNDGSLYVDNFSISCQLN